MRPGDSRREAAARKGEEREKVEWRGRETEPSCLQDSAHPVELFMALAVVRGTLDDATGEVLALHQGVEQRV